MPILRWLFLAMFLADSIACDLVVPTNPFDIDTRPEEQAPGTLRGTIAVSDASDAEARAATLAVVRVGLLDETGRRVSRDGATIAVALNNVAEDADGRSAGTFQLPPLIPGSYTIVVDGAPAQYQAPVLPNVRLLPGDEVDVGELLYAFVGGDDEGPGRIEGEVRAVGGAVGQHRVTLFRRSGGTTVLVRSVVTDAGFTFGALAFGSYAVVVESEGFTPVYRLGLTVAAQQEGEARPQHQFAGDAALVVHPVTAALQPSIDDGTVVVDEGRVYVRGDSVPLLVLPFVARAELEVGITGMRLATDPSFLDTDEQPLPFGPHQATTTVPLPAEDGPVEIFAQFEARSRDGAFVFVSPTVSLAVIRDTTAPSIAEVRAIGLQRDALGVLSPLRTIPLAIDVSDATSGVDAVGVAFDAEPLVLSDVTAPPGLQRVAISIVAAADGNSSIFVAAEDRAGNRTVAEPLPVVIDTVAPDIALDVIGADDGFLRSRTATVDVSSLLANDDQIVVAVGLEGSVNERDTGPLGQVDIVLPDDLGQGAVVTFEAVAFDLVGNRTSVTRTISLDLRGSVRGVLVSDAVPGIVANVSGATVELFDARATLVGGPVTVDASGAFQFPGVVQGRDHRLRASLAGHGEVIVREIVVDAGAAVDLGRVPLVLSRGELRGRVLRDDLAADAPVHAGIAISAQLVSPSRVFSATAITDATGSWTLRDVPRTIAGESLLLSARATDYRSASAEVALDAAVVVAPLLLLPLGRGDFDICRSDAIDCAPSRFFSTDTVDLRLRDPTGIVALHVALDSGPSERLPLGDGNRTTMSVADRAEGEVVVTLQVESSDGSRSSSVSSTIVRDTTPPESSADCASCILDGSTLFARDPLGQVTLDLFAQDENGSIDHVDLFVDDVLVDGGRAFARFLTSTLSVIPGSHTVRVAFTDVAGNVGSAPTLTITQDAVAPVPGVPAVVLLSPAGQPLLDGAIVAQRDLRLQLAATGADSLLLSEDSACAVGTVLPFSTTANLTVTAGEGRLRQVFVRFLDRAGNASSCVGGRPFILDETPPSVTLATIEAPGGLANSRVVTVRIDATDASTSFGGTLQAHVSRHGSFLGDDGDGERIVSLAALGSTTFPYSLLPPTTPVGAGDGLKTIPVRIIDSAGRVTERSLTVILDETVPSRPTAVAPGVDAFVATSTPTFRWTVAAEANRYRVDVVRAVDDVLVLSQEVTTTTFTPTTPLADGGFRWIVRAFDAANNDSGFDLTFNPPQGLSFTVDTTAPTPSSILAVTGGSPTTDRQPTLTWTESTDLQTRREQIDYVVELSATANFASIAVSGLVTGAGTFAVPVVLSDGAWFWRVTARDRAGNGTTTTAPTPFVIDTTAPLAVAFAEVATVKRPPVVLSWTTPADADRVGVRLQLSDSATFGALLLDSLEGGTTRDVTALLTSGSRYFARVAAEDALGNRNFLSVVSFNFDGVAPTVPTTGAVVALRADGTAFADDALVVDRTIGVRLNAGAPGEVVFARLSNNPDCSNPTTFTLDQPGTSDNVIAWSLASGSAFKGVFVRFIDEAGNASACIASQRLRSSGTVRGMITVLTGSSGLAIGSGERSNARVVLSGPTAGLPLTAVTNGEGGYVFAGVPIAAAPGTGYTLTFTKDGFTATSTVAVIAEPDQDVTAPPGTLTVQSGSISGTVTVRHASPGGSFCASTDPQNATTTTMTLDGTAFTGEQVTRTLAPAANGVFTFTGVPAGTYALLASRDGSAVTSAPANPFLLAAGQTLSGRNFTIDDRVAPSAPLLRLLDSSPTSASTATVAIDLAASDSTSPSNLRGYSVTRVSLPLPGDTGVSLATDLGVFAAASTSMSIGLDDQRINRLVVTPVDCSGNRGPNAELQIVRDSVRPEKVTNVRVDNRDGSVVATWDPSPSRDVTAYRVYYGALDSSARTDFTGTAAAQGPSPLLVSASPTPSQSLSGLINATSFFVAVTAVDAAGNESQLLSERAIATPSRAPVDLRFESTVAQTCAQAADIVADLDATERLVVVTTGLSTPGLLVFENDGRDELTLVGSVVGEARARVTLLGDFAVVYNDTGSSGDTRIYDLRDPTTPTLVSTGNAFDSCGGCVFRHISNEGFAAINGGATFYGATYRINDTTERLAVWRRNVATNRNLFTFAGGAFINLNINTPARAFLQVGELFFVQHSSQISLYRMTPAGSLEHIVNRTGGTQRENTQLAYSDPYLFVPDGNTTVRVFVVDPGTRTNGAGTSNATFIELGSFTTRAIAQAVVFAGNRLLVLGTRGQTQRIVEAFDQSGLSTSIPQAQRTMPTSLGSTILRAENEISQFTLVNAKVVGSQLPALFHFNGASSSGCASTRRELRLKLFELGSGRAVVEGVRIPRGGATMSTTRFTDLRGGVLVTTENSGSTTRVKAYDVRDPAASRLIAESAAFDGGGGLPSGRGINDISGIAARQGAYVFVAHADPSPRSRRVGIVDVAFPQTGIRTVTVGTDNPFNATTPENVLGMQIVDDVVVMATGDSFNDPVNPNVLAVIPADTPSVLPAWTQVDAGIPMAGVGLMVEGAAAFVAATSTGIQVGRLCRVDVSTLAAPGTPVCVPTRTPSSLVSKRAFTAGRLPGHFVIGSDEGIVIFAIRGFVPSSSTPVDAVAQLEGIGVPLTIASSGPALFTTFGNSSALPLGALVAADASPASNGVFRLSLVGSLNDADSGQPTTMSIQGNVLALPSEEAAFAAQLIELF